MEPDRNGLEPESVVREKRTWGNAFLALAAASPFVAFIAGYFVGGDAEWAFPFGLVVASTFGLAFFILFLAIGASLRRSSARLAQRLAAERGQAGPPGP